MEKEWNGGGAGISSAYGFDTVSKKRLSAVNGFFVFPEDALLSN